MDYQALTDKTVDAYTKGQTDAMFAELSGGEITAVEADRILTKWYINKQSHKLFDLSANSGFGHLTIVVFAVEAGAD